MASFIEKGVEALKHVILPAVNPYLSGNFAPVQDELLVNELPVTGEIPKDLTGIYMRNGPNPQFAPIRYTFPYDGDGMIHAVYIAEGKAHYRNRYVETKGLMKERRAGKTLYGSSIHPMPMDPEWADAEDEPVAIKNGAFIHIIRHGGKYLATKETSTAYEVTRELSTLGEWDPYKTGHPIHLSPHTRLDPLTGELWVVNYEVQGPYLTFYRIDKNGNATGKWDIDKPHCSLVHDFVLTEHYAIVFDCPAVLDLKKIEHGGPILDWRPELGVRIGVMPRSGGPMKWFQTDTFFVFHFANAYEYQEQIIVDYVHYNQAIVTTAENDDATLYRTTINLKDGTVKNTQMDDRLIEFPRIREDRDTLQHRFIYIPTQTPVFKARAYHALVKYDMEHQQHDIHEFGPHAQIDEAVFVPTSSPASEDDGYLMLFVYDNETDQSEFVILDARNMTSEPLARVQMPRRVPHGLHGTWMSGPWQGKDC